MTRHNRPFNLSRLAKRRTYSGFSYDILPRGPRDMSGAEWQDVLASLRVEHNGDCVAAYEGASLAAEVYES